MTSAVAKKTWIDRAKMEINLFDAKEKLVASCKKEGPNKRIIASDLEKLEKVWNAMKDIHVTYCSSANINVECKESKDYLTVQREVYVEGIDMAEERMSSDKTSMRRDLMMK